MINISIVEDIMLIGFMDSLVVIDLSLYQNANDIVTKLKKKNNLDI